MWQHWKILGDSFGGFLTIRSILYAWKNLKDIQSLPLAPGKFTASDVTQQVASGCWWRGPFLLLPFLFFLPFPPPTPLPPPPPSSSSFSLLLSFLLFLSFLPCPLRFENIQLSFLGREREREREKERERRTMRCTFSFTGPLEPVAGSKYLSARDCCVEFHYNCV